MRRFAAPFAFVLLVSALVPGGAGAGGQHFTDETLQRMPALADRSTDADFGDIDGDGDLDIVVSNGVASDQPNLVYVNDGTGRFANETDARIPLNYENTSDSELGDVDRDGDLDLLVVSNTSVAENWADLLLNDGAGVFMQAGNWLPSRGSSTITGAEFGDIRMDLSMDFVIASYGNNLLLINWVSRFWIAEPWQFPRGLDDSNDIYFADLDGDLDLDVIVINGLGDRNTLLLNDGSGLFSDVTDERLPADTQEGGGAAILDVDGDEDLDIYVANAFIPALNRLWINDGSGYFTDESEDRIPQPGAVSVGATAGDIDNDGDFDLLVANLASQGIGQATRVYVNDGTGHFTDETVGRFPIVEESTSDVAVGDIDMDGDLDLYVANYGDDLVEEQNRLLINQSTPDSFPPSIVRTFEHPDTGETEEGYLVTTSVWDNIAVAQGELTVAIFYRAAPDTVSAGTGGFTELPMLWSGGHLFRQEIPAQPTGTRVDYYVRARDRMGNTALDPPGAPDSVYSFVVDVSLGIGDGPGAGASLPRSFSLSQNYPNPFNPSTTIDYEIPAGAGGADPGNGGDDRLGLGSAPAQGTVPVDLRIYDLRGRLVRTLVDGERAPGRHSVHWDGRNDHGESVGSGVYLYRLQAGTFVSTKKMIVTQ